MVAVRVERLGLDGATNSHVVVLREVNGPRFLPIWIGKPEAEAIATQLNHVKRERPLTHDLCKSVIMALGGTLRALNIHRVYNSTYFADLVIGRGTDLVQIDTRPSDGIAVALRLDAPIFADASLLATPAGEAVAPLDTSSVSPTEMTAEELQAYLAGLRPEDFGKFNP